MAFTIITRPAVAALILIMIGLSISLVSAEWILGLYNKGSSYEALVVMPGSKLLIYNDTVLVVVKVFNRGSKPADVVSVEVKGVGVARSDEGNVVVVVNETTLNYVPPNSSALIVAWLKDSKNVRVGKEYHVVIKTKSAKYATIIVSFYAGRSEK